ncbi:MAG: hypothetical protein M3Z21_15290, partial [Pseudomonadota bacterium]|nr:hypothetical protein [Pseudomonadota bacterium]
SAPAVCFVCAKSPGTEGPDGKWYSRGSIVLLDELATHDPDNLNRGMNYTIPQIAEEIRALAKRWRIPPDGVADDACFSRGGHAAGSIAEEFRQFRVYFRHARKGDRRVGWERMRRMLQDAGKSDVPGLFISRECGYFWRTVPFLSRDPRKADDVDSRGPDHGADAARYAIMGMTAGVGTGSVMGLY